MGYRCLRPLLFFLPPEFAHRLTLFALRLGFPASRVLKLRAKDRQLPKPLLNLQFPNPIGLAAGLDKDGEAMDALFGLGFGFIEVGAVTPKPQPGNPKPRIFRLKKARALINRFGFNNEGVDALVERLKRRKVPGIVGVNLGKNALTPLTDALNDYKLSFQKVFRYADFVTINISSPNTKNLRCLQSKEELFSLLSSLKQEQQRLSELHQRTVPLFVKISPDLTDLELAELCEVVLSLRVEGIIAVNTTIDHSVVAHEQYGHEQGGLSGKPLLARSAATIKRLAELTAGRVVLVGVGGVASAEDARMLLQCGADLIQLYTALVYEGPGLVRRIINHL